MLCCLNAQQEVVHQARGHGWSCSTDSFVWSVWFCGGPEPLRSSALFIYPSSWHFLKVFSWHGRISGHLQWRSETRTLTDESWTTFFVVSWGARTMSLGLLHQNYHNLGTKSHLNCSSLHCCDVYIFWSKRACRTGRDCELISYRCLFGIILQILSWLHWILQSFLMFWCSPQSQ